MFSLLFLICFVSVCVTSAPNDDYGDARIWEELRGVLPDQYSEYAEKSGLSLSRRFQNNVINKLHNQVVSDTKALEARQKILLEYVNCSCPKCDDDDKQVESEADRPRELRPLGNPFNIITNFFTSCETELVLETIKILRANLLTLQLRNQQIVALVACNCPNSRKCRKILDPLIFSIVSGANDTELAKAYWQTSLDGFPRLMERGLMDRLQSAIASIMTYVFQATRPQHDAQQSPNQNAPPTIFSPGNNEQTWQNTSPPERTECPSIHVTITNNRDGSTDIKVPGHATEISESTEDPKGTVVNT